MSLVSSVLFTALACSFLSNVGLQAPHHDYIKQNKFLKVYSGNMP